MWVSSGGLWEGSVVVLYTNTCGNFMDKGRLDGNRWMPHVLRMEVEEKEVIQNHTHADFIFPECFSKQFPACEFVYCL